MSNQVVKLQTAGDAYRWIKNDHAHRCDKVGWIDLKYGVGNDMSGPFYTNRGCNQYEWWPNGINGPLIRIEWDES